MNKEQWRTICTSLLCRQRNDQFLTRVVTGDEKWVLYINKKRTCQWLSPNQLAIPTPKESLTLKKVFGATGWSFSAYELSNRPSCGAGSGPRLQSGAYEQIEGSLRDP